MTSSKAFATSADRGVYYDPYDFEIDRNPYPVWKRLRDEAPLYYNDKHDFFALSRYDDVERCSKDWRTYSSARGTVLEIIKSGATMPPGMIIFEDPPTHDLHRALLAGVFKPRRIAELEPKVRQFCARCLDPLVGSGGFDFIGDIGADVPMRTIGMLLGIPEEQQVAVRAMPSELVGGALLTLGLLTRVACVLLAVTMLVASRLGHKGGGYFITNDPPGAEYTINLAAKCVALALLGPGPYSMDALLMG